MSALRVFSFFLEALFPPSSFLFFLLLLLLFLALVASAPVPEFLARVGQSRVGSAGAAVLLAA